ncbi:MAG: hypothetical protein JSR66_19640 [Proteobacteria bacterium]|nr:hypothetical protein [Pseudomonadota bacterium]
MYRKTATFALVWMAFATIQTANASAPACGQAQVEKLLGAPAPPAASSAYIVPKGTVSPFYQWESNNGYCGEASLISAGLNNGQWLSQYNLRQVCGTFFGPETNGYGASLLQAGNPPGRNANYNDQVLLQTPGQGLSGSYDFGFAARCAANARLQLTSYPTTTGYQSANTGTAGYQDFMKWIKAQTIAGKQVTLGVLFNGSDDDQYDHIVSVIKIGTNHSPTDPSYYADDVLYFDDHGLHTLTRNSSGQWAWTSNPGVPPGAGSDPNGCTPYVYGYTFGSLGKSRTAANANGAGAYSVVIPKSSTSVLTVAGNTGNKGTSLASVPGPHNFGFAVSGPVDSQGVTLPVTLNLVQTQTLVNGSWRVNPADTNSTPAVGYNYENPYIGGAPGTCDDGDCVSNAQPAAMQMTLQATVRGLTAGTQYKLYEYDLPTLTGANTGTAAALNVPTANFNANSAMATSVTTFTAQGATYTTPTFSRTSDQVVVLRAVPSSAP